jgi:YidC/Oxa1 family membrane protein insertase
MLALLKTVFYVPLYNGLIFLVALLPGRSAGAAVILLTVIIKLLLFPLSQKAAKFQLEMKAHEEEIRRIKEKYKKDKQAQGKAILDFYREKGINPFAGILPVFIQIPVVIALYYVFFKGGLPSVDTGLLYSFVPVPEVDMEFLGMDIGGKSLVLAVLVGVTQYLQGRFAMPPLPPRSDAPSFQDDLARGMQVQMKYMLPLFMGFVSYAVSGAVALYFITSNLFMIGQEVYLRRKFKSRNHLTHKGKDRVGSLLAD